MPLVRFEVRNEVGLGDPELYGGGGGGGGGKRGEAEPKALLEGVAVAGLVGILRQLGDLAEFAADVFHDLHEQVITTSARGRRVLTRVQNIEAALPSLEKAVKNQKSHIHFAYVPGSDWHAQLQNEQNQLLSSDLPRFMMDSYEECRDPPRLYLLDKFDNAGAGACLKRYSDPFYFKRAWDMTKIDKSRNVQREKRTQKVKRKGSRLKNGESYHGQTTSRLRNGELQQVVGAARHTSRRFTSPSMDGYSFSENRSTPDARSNPEIVSRSSSFGSKAKLTSVEQALDTKPAVVPPESSHEKPSDVKLQYKLNDASSSVVLNGASMNDSNNDSKQVSLTDEMVVRSPSVKWDEKAEITMSTSSVYCDDVVMDKTQDAEPIHINLARKEIDHREMENLEQQEVLLQKAKLLLVSSGLNHHDEIPSETDNYMDALNTLESETETEVECQTKNHMKSVPQAGAIENLVSQHPDSSLAEVHDTCHTSEKPGDIHDLSNADPTEISEPALSVYTAIPPNKGSSVINHMSNVEEASQDSTDQETGCTASFEHTNMQANEPFEIVSVAKSSPVDATDGTPDISESKAQDSPGKNDREGLGCGAPSISDMQTVSSNESLDKGPATQDGPSNISDTSLGVSSIKLWTNAGLFGLEPSKPPVFGARDGPSEDILPGSKEPQCSHSTDYTELRSSKVPESALVDVPNGNASITSSFMGKLVGIRPISANHSSSGLDQSATRTSHIVQTNGPVDCSTSFEHSEQKNMIDKLNSVSLLEKSQDNAENGVQMYPAERFNTSVVSGLPLTSKANPEYHHSFDSSMSISSSFSSIAQRFLANTLQRRTAPKYTDLPASSERVNCDASAADEATPICNPNISPNGTVLQSSQFEENKENSTNGLSTTSIFSSCHYSEQSSPPLEYMKISFHPMNAFEMSKLDVEFSDGNFHENVDDLMLPFQLPPGSSVPLPGSGSESEDDTFGRSYSYSSYDDLSPHLYSNSELWDQEEEIGMEENELCNNSNQTGSSATLISSTMCFEQLNSAVKITDTLAEMGDQNERAALESYTAGELPNFDTLMSTNNQQNGDAFMQCNPANLSFENEDQLPPPPPLPPVQWRTTKPTSSLGEDTGINAKDGLKKSLSLPPLHGPIVQEDRFPPATLVAPPQPQGPQHAKNVHDQKVDMVKELNHLPCISEIKASLLQQIRDKPDQQKLNGHEKPKAIGGDTKPLDEREELLQQIRTKTFNLRRADTTKPNGLSQSNANSSVVAILEKANAIRQAVASDEGGDDDNWSDI